MKVSPFQCCAFKKYQQNSCSLSITKVPMKHKRGRDRNSDTELFLTFTRNETEEALSLFRKMSGKTELSSLRCPSWDWPGPQAVAEFPTEMVGDRNILMFVRIWPCQQKEEPLPSPLPEVHPCCCCSRGATHLDGRTGRGQPLGTPSPGPGSRSAGWATLHQTPPGCSGSAGVGRSLGGTTQHMPVGEASPAP